MTETGGESGKKERKDHLILEGLLLAYSFALQRTLDSMYL